jgi:signal transduction histidine kinase
LTEQQDKRSKHVERIKSAVNNLNDILSDFLSLSKIEEGKVLADFRKFNLFKLVGEVIAELKPIAQEGQEISHSHQGNEQANLDPKLIRNILINLISNAVKFSPGNNPVRIDTVVTEDTVQISVKDEGIGISPEDQEHLFERFFRGRNATNIQGTGLGLNIVLKYVELMGGRIELESVLDQGTEFKIIFPVKS